MPTSGSTILPMSCLVNMNLRHYEELRSLFDSKEMVPLCGQFFTHFYFSQGIIFAYLFNFPLQSHLLFYSVTTDDQNIWLWIICPGMLSVPYFLLAHTFSWKCWMSCCVLDHRGEHKSTLPDYLRIQYWPHVPIIKYFCPIFMGHSFHVYLTVHLPQKCTGYPDLSWEIGFHYSYSLLFRCTIVRESG